MASQQRATIYYVFRHAVVGDHASLDLLRRQTIQQAASNLTNLSGQALEANHLDGSLGNRIERRGRSGLAVQDGIHALGQRGVVGLAGIQRLGRILLAPFHRQLLKRRVILDQQILNILVAARLGLRHQPLLLLGHVISQ